MRQVFFLAVPCLMTIIFAHQVYQNFYSTLNPWKGGGFGMFASTDSPGARFVTTYGFQRGSGDTLLLAHSFQDIIGAERLPKALDTRLKSWPSEGLLRQFGEVLIQNNYVTAGQRIVPEWRTGPGDTLQWVDVSWSVCRPLKNYTLREGIPSEAYLLDSIELRVLKLAYYPETNEIITEPLVGQVMVRK